MLRNLMIWLKYELFNLAVENLGKTVSQLKSSVVVPNCRVGMTAYRVFMTGGPANINSLSRNVCTWCEIFRTSQ